MARNFLALASIENAARYVELGLQRFPHDAGLRRMSSQLRPHLERRAPGTPR
jgi:hypothetical protein